MEEEPSHQSKTPSPSLTPERESVGFASPIPSSSPLPLSVSRLWRPSAQRNLRNQWSKLASLRQQWSSSSSAGRSHATSLVNAYLSQKYIPSMELGVLSDMPAIRNKASLKLFKQQEVHQSNLLSSYKDMVSIVTQMVKTSKSMRCYLKGASSSSLIRFSDSPEDQSDLGDGGGIPVFTFLSISSFEKFADELVQMLILELNLKENSEPIFPQTGVSKSDVPIAQYNPQPNQETLKVYLTTWLAEVNVDTYRVDEIFSVIGEEMHVKIS